MVNELDAIANLFNSLGVSALFGPMIATIMVFYLLRKYVMAGAGKFVQDVTNQYLKSLNDRIVLETKIDLRLEHLTSTLEKFVMQLADWEKRNSERITTIKDELSERITNIEVVLSDRIFEELRELKGHFEEHADDMEEIMSKDHDCKKKIANMDTEVFRATREAIKKEL